MGVRFRGHVRRNGRGPVYWTTCTISACEPGRDFAFTVGVGKRVANTWSYHFEPSGDGTDVTESYALTETPVTRAYWKLFGKARGRTNVNGMRATLEQIKAVVEAPADPLGSGDRT